MWSSVLQKHWQVAMFSVYSTLHVGYMLQSDLYYSVPRYYLVPPAKGVSFPQDEQHSHPLLQMQVKHKLFCMQ